MKSDWSAYIPIDVATDLRLGYPGLRLLIVLSGMVDHESYCWPSDGRLAELSKLSVRNVQKTLTRLVQLKVIERSGNTSRRVIRLLVKVAPVQQGQEEYRQSGTGVIQNGVPQRRKNYGQLKTEDRKRRVLPRRKLYVPRDPKTYVSLGRTDQTQLSDPENKNLNSRPHGRPRGDGLGVVGTPPAPREEGDRTKTNPPPAPASPPPIANGLPGPDSPEAVHARVMRKAAPLLPDGKMAPEPTEQNIATQRKIAAIPGPPGMLSRLWLENHHLLEQSSKE